MEERRLRTESQPFGRLLEQFVSTAFMAHPYHHPVIGYASDIQSYTMTDAKKFYEDALCPNSNMVTAIVGDIQTKQGDSTLGEIFWSYSSGFYANAYSYGRTEIHHGKDCYITMTRHNRYI